MPDDYEIMPHREIIKLKEEIKKLKSGKAGSIDYDLKAAIDDLRMSIDKMLAIFREAAREIKEEDPGIFKKLDEISDQNEKIANAILALVDMIKEKQETKPEIAKIAPMPTTIPKPQFPPLETAMPQMPPPMPQMAPPFPPFPRMPPPQSFSELPPLQGAPPPAFGPLPPLPPKKKGLFGR